MDVGKNSQPAFQDDVYNDLIHTVHTAGTTLTPSLWINMTYAVGMKTSCGKGGGTGYRMFPHVQKSGGEVENEKL